MPSGELNTTRDLENTPHFRQRGWLTWLLAITAGISLLIMWQCTSALARNRRLANAAVEHFHSELNSGQYSEIFREADAGFTEGKTDEDLIKFLQAIRAKLGDVGAADLTGINVKATTNGTFVTVRCKTTFARGTTLETFTWAKTGNTLRLYGYDIRQDNLNGR